MFDLVFQCLEASLASRRLVSEFADEFGGAPFAGRRDAVGLCGVHGGVRQGLRHGLLADAVPAQVAGDAGGCGAPDLASSRALTTWGEIEVGPTDCDETRAA
ncbi:hypothetical protein ACIQZB_42305 [Streptomyces sp. NPDC097727]|uniref:hypothetical protein n=1 Tax=Streptomyces sp. NPDC097727 TaxID=3366092 RepID=UPI0038282E8D